MCQKARLLDADSLPWTLTLTFYKLLEIERLALGGDIPQVMPTMLHDALSRKAVIMCARLK